jgi:hypothetical protein
LMEPYLKDKQRLQGITLKKVESLYSLSWTIAYNFYFQKGH